MADKYFLYSQEQYEEKNTILQKTNKQFVPGTVVVNGTTYNFTALSNTSTLPRFIDTKVIAQGDPKNFTYTMPSTIKERR